MEAKRIGLWGAERLEAIKAGHPFAVYSVTLEGTTLYFTARQYARVQPTLYALQRELNRASTKLFRLRRHYEACDAERERAVDGWYDEDKENAALRSRLEELGWHNRTLRDDNLRLMAHEGQLRRNEEQLRGELSKARRQADESDFLAHNSEQNGDNPFYFTKELTPQERRSAAKFLRSCIPNSRRRAAKVAGVGHDYPNDFGKKLEVLRSQRYVARVHWVQRPPIAVKNGEVTCVQEGEHYTVVAPYFSDRFGADIKVETTAKSPAEAEYLKTCIEELIQ